MKTKFRIVFASKAKVFRKKMFSKLNKLAKKYCVSGELHDLNEENICNKCKKNPFEYKFTDKELELMNKNIDEKTYEMNLESFKLMKKFLDDKETEQQKIKKILTKFNKRYDTNTNKMIQNYKLPEETITSCIVKSDLSNEIGLKNDSILTHVVYSSLSKLN
jgi:hypothetical protein